MKERDGMTRREFFAAGAGLAGAAAFAPRGSAGGVVGRGRRAQNALKSRVVLVKTESRAEGVNRCIDLFGMDPIKGKRVLVKPNFNTSDECPGSTHNDTLVALLTRLREMGPSSLAIGDRSGPEDTQQVFEKKGIPEIAGRFDAKLLNFDDLGETGYVPINPPTSHWKDGFLVARPVVAAESVVSTCCLKTHQFGGVFSMSLKNSVGIVPRKGHRYMSQLHGSKENQRRMIAEINTAYRPALIVLDGLTAFVDQGPMTGPRKDAGVFLTGTDRVAVDAVALAVLRDLGSNDAIMKTPIFAQEQIAWAATIEVGVSSAADIVIVTGDPASEAYAEKLRKILAA